jgi:hypothetical protein
MEPTFVCAAPARDGAEEARAMPDFTAIEIEAEEIVDPLSTTFLDEVRTFVTGALFTAAVAVVGTILFTLALMIAVVGSPLVAAVVAVLVLRRGRVERLRSLALRPATS